MTNTNPEFLKAPPPKGDPGLVSIPTNVESSSQPKNVDPQVERAAAKKVVSELQQGRLPRVEKPKEPILAVTQQKELARQLDKVETWVVDKKEELPLDTAMLQTLVDIATAPPVLQNDPTWLLAKGAEVRAALRADMPAKVQDKAGKILHTIYDRITKLEGLEKGMQDPQIRISKDPAVRQKVEFVQLAGNALLPEAGMTMAPAPVEPTVVEQIYQGSSDALARSLFAEVLEDTRDVLRLDRTGLHNTHALGAVKEKIGKIYIENKKVPGITAQAQAAMDRIQAVIDETVTAQQARMPARRNDALPSLGSEGGSDWIYEKSKDGIKIVPQDRLDLETGDLVNLQPLRDVLVELEATGHVNDARGIFAQTEMLERLVDDPKTGISPKDIAPYKAKLLAHLNALEGERWKPTSAEMETIRSKRPEDWKKRDEIFFKRINDVIQNQFESSRQIQNLYKEASLDMFLGAVRQEVGDRAANRYEHLKQSIFFNHDVEQIARSAAGDIEILQKLVHSAHTSFMLEAIHDPVVEAMSASLEQALRKLLRDHNGYLPPDLFRYKDGEVYWHKLARQYFEAKVRAGAVFDYNRDENGFAVPKENGVGYEIGKQFTEQDLKDQKLRIDASLELGKGVGIFNHRLLELFATAKAPGTDTANVYFSSPAYEGIARFFRPMTHLFEKYQMGELSFKAIFGTLIDQGGHIPEGLNFRTWSPQQWKEVNDAMMRRDLSGWLEKKFGKDMGAKLYRDAKPFVDIAEEFIWTGRFGPHSTWGELDATVKWSDLKRELEGGSIRLGRAEWWAKRYLEGQYEHHLHEWEHMPFEEKDTMIKRVMKSYSAWVWAQMTLRNPLAVAENVFTSSNGVLTETGFLDTERKIRCTTLREKLVKDILKFDINEKITTEATPTQEQRNYMERVAILEADVAAIQHKALYGGPNREPREIKPEDYAIIQDDREAPINPLTGQKIPAEIRREQAQAYIEGVRKAMFGDTWKTIEDVKQALGITFGAARVKDRQGEFYDLNDMLHIGNEANIDKILSGLGGKLTADLIARKQDIYMSMDDTRLGDMDIANLGERAFARLTNDAVNRKEAIGVMQLLLGEFRQEMDKKKVLELMQKLYDTEKAGRGPESARAFVYYFARLFGEYYRGHWIGELPILGKVLKPALYLSVAQMIHGKEHGEVWSINNMREWLHEVAQIGALEHHAVNHDGSPNKYSIQRLERELVASRKAVIYEIAAIGLVLAAIGVGAAAALKSKEDQEESGH